MTQHVMKSPSVAGMCVFLSFLSPAHITKDACFPAHSYVHHYCIYVLQVIVIYVSLGILFPHQSTLASGGSEYA